MIDVVAAVPVPVAAVIVVVVVVVAVAVAVATAATVDHVSYVFQLFIASFGHDNHL